MKDWFEKDCLEIDLRLVGRRLVEDWFEKDCLEIDLRLVGKDWLKIGLKKIA